jgi:hypothetical protein
MELHLKIIGITLIALALAHTIFPRYFDWKNDLGPLSLINRQMMIFHTLFIALTVLLMGSICLTSTEDIIGTKFGNNIALGFCLFWLVRLLVQFFGYSPELWRGKRFETFIHIVFSAFWAYMSTIFFLIYWQGRK